MQARLIALVVVLFIDSMGCMGAIILLPKEYIVFPIIVYVLTIVLFGSITVCYMHEEEYQEYSDDESHSEESSTDIDEQV